MSDFDLNVTRASRLEASYYLSGVSDRLRELLADKMVWIEAARNERAQGQICILCKSDIECLESDMREARRLIAKELPFLETTFVSPVQRWQYGCARKWLNR